MKPDLTIHDVVVASGVAEWKSLSLVKQEPEQLVALLIYDSV